ncbi:MAG: protein kinase [Planctomycetes bacterium]|nr:protein kinase [Planctomycetota bacterium]
MDPEETTILVADDDPSIRVLLTHTLKRSGYACVEATNGAEVLDRIGALIPDLILMDVRMPKLDGVEVCRRLRSMDRMADVPIILISAYGDEASILDGFDAGASDYVVKPFHAPVLLAKVRATLAARTTRRGDPSILDLAPGTLFDGRFTIVRKLGRGGMGIVYLAREVDPDRGVAIKILDCRDDDPRESSERFGREVAALSRIDHPNVVRIQGSGLFRGHHYYAMEYVGAPTIREALEERGAFSAPEAFLVAASIADGLAEVHRSGFVHRDVKPANVFLVPAPTRAKIADFGIAFPVETGEVRLTREGIAIGTAHYMSPEQSRGETVDARSDLYSLGTVLYEMLTGDVPYPEDSALEAVTRILNGERPAPRSVRPDLPAAADEICFKAWKRIPAERFRDASAFAMTLRRAAGED